MKNKLVFLLALGVIFITSGCENNATETIATVETTTITSEAEITTVEIETTAFESENTTITEIIIEDVETTEPITTSKSTTKNPYIGTVQAEQKSETPSEIYNGDVITVEDKYELTFRDCYYSYDVIPPNRSGTYHHYPADEDKIYLTTVIDYKNLNQRIKDCDEVGKVSVLYDGKYSYNGFWIIEEDNGSDLDYARYSSLDPFEKATLYYLIAIPEEVINYESEVCLIIDGRKYNIVI